MNLNDVKGAAGVHAAAMDHIEIRQSIALLKLNKQTTDTH